MVPPLRVLHVLCDLSGGGAERLVLDLARHSRGLEVLVCPVFAGGGLERGFAEHEIPVRSLDARRGRPDREAFGRLVRWCEQADVVHTHLWVGHVWGRAAGWLADTPVVSTIHNTEGDGPWRDALLKKTDPLASRVVGVSHAVWHQLLEQGIPSCKAGVVHNGIDHDRCAVAPFRQHGRVVLGVGRITPQKGFDVLAEAAKDQAFEVRIAGQGPALEGVHLLGFQKQLRDLYAQADVVCIPSRWEGFGLVAVEAMASGVPVIASDIAPLREVLGDVAEYVPTDAPAALRKAITQLLADPDARARMRQRGLVRAQHFDINRTALEYQKVYLALVADTPTGDA